MVPSIPYQLIVFFVWYYRTQLECSSYSHDPWPMSLQLQQPEIRTMCQNTY